MPEAFDDLMDGAKRHADSASYSNPIAPEIPEHAIISICLEQQIEIRELRKALNSLRDE